jgi:hypothetical protein
VWTLAALSVGARVGRHLVGPVDARLVGPAALPDLAAGADPGADEVLAAACDAFGMPIPGGVPAGVVDVGLEARAHPDVLAVEPGASQAAVLVGGGHEQPWPALLAQHAAAGAASTAGPRIWVDAAVPDADLLLAVAVLPLLLGGSVVLDTGLSAAEAATTRAIEAVTVDAPALLG